MASQSGGAGIAEGRLQSCKAVAVASPYLYQVSRASHKGEWQVPTVAELNKFCTWGVGNTPDQFRARADPGLHLGSQI